ncbi:hypothetical protein ACT7CZ_23370 [Bacillus cereus]
MLRSVSDAVFGKRVVSVFVVLAFYRETLSIFVRRFGATFLTHTTHVHHQQIKNQNFFPQTNSNVNVVDPIDPGFGGCGPCGHGHHHHHHGHQISPFGPGPNVSPFGPGPNVSPFLPNNVSPVGPNIGPNVGGIFKKVNDMLELAKC